MIEFSFRTHKAKRYPINPFCHILSFPRMIQAVHALQIANVNVQILLGRIE